MYNVIRSVDGRHSYDQPGRRVTVRHNRMVADCERRATINPEAMRKRRESERCVNCDSPAIIIPPAGKPVREPDYSDVAKWMVPDDWEPRRKMLPAHRLMPRIIVRPTVRLQA